MQRPGRGVASPARPNPRARGRLFGSAPTGRGPRAPRRGRGSAEGSEVSRDRAAAVAAAAAAREVSCGRRQRLRRLPLGLRSG